MKNGSKSNNGGTVLSVALLSHKCQRDRQKISLVLCDICKIDKISQQISGGVETLYLSNNLISTLSNIEQFANLITLSLSNNFIKYLDALQCLSSLPHLKCLSLVGNKVTHVPYYHEHVLSLCPKLVSFDEIRIDASHHRAAHSSVFKIRCEYEQMQTNELRNCVLLHLSLLLHCHEEMHSGVFRSVRHLLGGSSDVNNATVKGVSSIMRQVLLGKVCHWLQLMAHSLFSHVVQDWLLKESKAGVASLSGGARLLQDQQRVAALMRFQQGVMVASLDRCNRVSVGEDSLDSVLDVVSVLAVDRTGAHMGHDDRLSQMSSHLNAATRSDRAKQGVVLVREGDARSHHLEGLAAVEARGRHVHEKYSSLLSRMKRQPLDAERRTGRIGTDKLLNLPVPHKPSSVLSHSLPPQQREPILVEGENTVETRALPNSIAPPLLETLRSDVISKKAKAVYSEEFDMSDGAGKTQSNKQFSGPTALQWEQQSASIAQYMNSCKHRSDKLEKAHAQSKSTKTASLASMHSLGEEVGSLKGTLHLALVEEVQLRKENMSLRSAARQYWENMSALVDQSQVDLSGRRQEALAVRQEGVEAGERLFDAQKVLADIQVLRDQVDSLRRAREQCAFDVEVLLQVAAQHVHTSDQLRTSLQKVSAVSTLIRGEMQSHVMEWEIHEPLLAKASVTFDKALLRRALKLWRRSVRRQSLIQQFQRRVRSRQGSLLVALCFLAWVRFGRIAAVGRVVERRKCAKRMRESLNGWRCRWRTEVSIAYQLRVHQLLRIRRAFQRLRTWPHLVADASGKLSEDSLCVALFVLVRVFRAWARLTKRERAHRAALTHMIRESPMRRLLLTWRLVAEKRQCALKWHASRVREHDSSWLMRKILHNWRAAFQFRHHLLNFRRKKRGFAAWLRFRRSSAATQNVSFSISAPSVCLRRALMQLLMLARRRTHLRSLIVFADDARSHSTRSRHFSYWKSITASEKRLLRLRADFAANGSTFKMLQSVLHCWVFLVHQKGNTLTGRFSDSNYSGGLLSNVAPPRHPAPMQLCQPVVGASSMRKGTMMCKAPLDFWSELDDEDVHDAVALDAFGDPYLEDLQLVPIGRTVHGGLVAGGVRSRALFRRWAERTSAARQRRLVSESVRRVIGRTCLRRAFLAIRRMWLTELHCKIEAMRKSVSEWAKEAGQCCEAVRLGCGDLLRHRESALRERMGDLEAALSSTFDQHGDAEVALQDVTLSIAGLSRQIAHTSSRIDAVSTKTAALAAFQNTSHCEYACVEPNAGMIVGGTEQYSTSSGSFDDRMPLMRDLEDLYGRAVAVQQQTLNQTSRVSTEATEHIRRQAALSSQLDEVRQAIAAALRRRSATESVLLHCTSNLDAALERVSSMATSHERACDEADMLHAEAELRLRCAAAQEHKLRDFVHKWGGASVPPPIGGWGGVVAEQLQDAGLLAIDNVLHCHQLIDSTPRCALEKENVPVQTLTTISGCHNFNGITTEKQIAGISQRIRERLKTTV